MPYGELISDAFRIAWRNRYLWFFGIFAGTSGPSFNFQSDFTDSSGSIDIDLAVVVAVVAVIALLAVVFIVLGVVSQGGLTDSVAAIARGERRDFRTTWRAGWSRFWRVLAYGVLLVLAVVAVVAALVVPLGALVVAVIVLTGSVVLSVVVGLLAGLIALIGLVAILLPFVAVAHFGLRELVLRGTSAAESLGLGWRLFRANIGTSLLLVLIQQAMALGATIVLGLAVLVLALPAIVLALAAPTAVAIAAGIVTAVIVLPAALAAVGAVGAFNHGFWTLAYLRLAASPPPSWPAAAPA